MTTLTFETTVTDQRAVVALEGELDLTGSSGLEAELERIEGPDLEELVLDLSGLRFMDSTGLRIVVMADQRARERGRRMILVRGNPDVQRVFELTRLLERLTFVDSVEDIA